MTHTGVLDTTDRHLLNQMQSQFPIVEQPFATMGRKLGLGEEEVLERARALRESGVLRHLSAIFDVYHVGYHSTLVSFSVPKERLEAAAAVVSAHPGVSHNYAREHEYNLWFVLAVPRSVDLEVVIADLAASAGIVKYHVLPALKLYKINVALDVVQGRGNQGRTTPRQKKAPRRELTAEEVALVRVLQEDLPLVSRPFAQMAADLAMTESKLLERASDLQEEGIMRRFAAVLRHRAVGFVANGMACWIVPEERLEECGAKFAAYPQVSHCYRRPTYEDWPYAIFTMVHAQSRGKCEETVRKMAVEVGIDDYAILYSYIEYKKERVKYYLE